MACDRCHLSGSIMKTVYTPDGWPMNICADCRKAIDNGATFALPKAAPRLSKLAKRLRAEDDLGDHGIPYTPPPELTNLKTTKVVDSPFARASWGRK